jgi:hypothetical protein
VRHTKLGQGLVDWLKPPRAASSQGLDIISKEITHGGDGLAPIMHAQRRMQGEVLGAGGDTASMRDIFQNRIILWAGQQCRSTAGSFRFSKAVSVSTLATYIAGSKDFCIFGFWITGMGGHACAAFAEGRFVTYFDPNWGVYKLPKAQFERWLSKEFSDRYGATMVDSGGVVDA